ncbi:ABC transporter substrate-binding protein [Microbacterium sp. NPDC077663]|uniref:ABC transporter substrate-binding protein n=1 Tax=Microbacterium sp. NPDC077663 TaxID=3364189 RepID=UPI0037C958B4
MHRRSRTVVIGIAALSTVLLVAGCSGQPADGEPTGDTDYVSGGTAIIAINADPGSINPLAANATTASYTVWGLAYDTLTIASTASSEPLPNLAESWDVTADTATFKIRDGIVCSDDSDVTPSVIAKSFDWVLNPDNASPWFGAFVPPGSTVTADDEAGTLTIQSPTPSSFLLKNLSGMPIVCGAGADDLSLTDDATFGSGMFELSQATPGQSYKFDLRPEYAWGPGDITAKDPGVPEAVELSVVPNESTAANLLLAGDVTIASIGGSDRDRLDSQSYFSVEYPNDPGLVFFNQVEGRATADLAVRKALSQALNLDDLGNIATGGRGEPLQTIVTGIPQTCSPETPISDFAPEFDADAAAAALDKAGWVEGSNGVREKDGVPLALNLLFPSNRGPGIPAAMEAIQTAWTELGVDVTLTGSDAYAGTLFSGGDWDAVWGPFATEDPSVWRILLSGDAPPAGRNFSSSNNVEYTELVAKAQSLPGSESCQTWLEAEQSLAKNVDVLPVTANTKTAYGDNAEFALRNPGAVLGSTIRLTK